MKTNLGFVWCGTLVATIFISARSTVANDDLSNAQRKQIKTLIQDVISVGIERDFQNGQISNQERIKFGIYQIALRRPTLLQNGKTPGEIRIADQYVAAAAQQFFGKNIEPQSVGDWKYRAGFYHGYTELFEQLGPAKVQRLDIRKIGKKQVTVYADFIDSMASADSNHQVIVKIQMTWRQVASPNGKRYILTAFKHLTKQP